VGAQQCKRKFIITASASIALFSPNVPTMERRARTHTLSTSVLFYKKVKLAASPLLSLVSVV
jgi:hypothetical protein